MSSILPRAGAALLAAIAMAAAPAAQSQVSLAQDSDAPIDITADELEVVNAQCLAIWRGAAEALQDQARLRADVMRIYSAKKSAARPGAGGADCGELTRIEAEGQVYYVTPQQSVRGDNAVYEASSETILFTGRVVAAQGRNVLRGERLRLNVATGQALVETSVQGRGKPGRVRGVFYPNQQQAARP